jgi:hypothetical protein
LITESTLDAKLKTFLLEFETRDRSKFLTDIEKYRDRHGEKLDFETEKFLAQTEFHVKALEILHSIRDNFDS